MNATSKTAPTPEAACMSKAKEEAKNWALYCTRDFLGELDRVKSIIDLMGEVVTREVNSAQGDDGDGNMNAWLPEAFVANIEWIFESLDTKIVSLRGHLEEAGLKMERRI